jgi:Fe2+ or Zn2+ uptake regulation protein
MPDREHVFRLLERHGIRPSAQRLVVTQHILAAKDHPSADELWGRIKRSFPALSRATVYNTLHLLAEKELVRELTLSEGRVVYDPITERHHHFIDVTDGSIHDIPWDALTVVQRKRLPGVEVDDFQVVMRGRRK